MIGDIGCTVMLLAPERLTFEVRTPKLALACCLFYLQWEDGEIGIEWSAG